MSYNINSSYKLLITRKRGYNKMNTKPFDLTALTLIIIGAINWGLIGFFKFDLVATVFGGMDSLISRIIYAVIGIAGLYTITFYGKLSSDMTK